jgi:hypothetical protein
MHMEFSLDEWGNRRLGRRNSELNTTHSYIDAAPRFLLIHKMPQRPWMLRVPHHYAHYVYICWIRKYLIPIFASIIKCNTSSSNCKEEICIQSYVLTWLSTPWRRSYRNRKYRRFGILVFKCNEIVRDKLCIWLAYIIF